MDGYERLRALSERMKKEVDGGAAPNPEELTVRVFLSWFGYARRGRNNVSQIRHMLAEFDLRTIPDFEFTWIDGMISIELDPDAVEGITAAEEQIDPTVRIGAIEAANRKPTTVDLNSPLSVATTLMQTNDFSQLPVMQGEREVKGIITWKSIGTKLSLGHECELVRDCMNPIAPEVQIEAPLFSAIGDISQHGYILVRGHDRVITGILTSSDLSDQFVQLAGPFLSLGEIEGYLRSLVDRKFTIDEMREALGHSGGEPPVSGPEDLTLVLTCTSHRHNLSWGHGTTSDPDFVDGTGSRHAAAMGAIGDHGTAARPAGAHHPGRGGRSGVGDDRRAAGGPPRHGEQVANALCRARPGRVAGRAAARAAEAV